MMFEMNWNVSKDNLTTRNRMQLYVVLSLSLFSLQTIECNFKVLFLHSLGERNRIEDEKRKCWCIMSSTVKNDETAEDSVAAEFSTGIREKKDY